MYSGIIGKAFTSWCAHSQKYVQDCENTGKEWKLRNVRLEKNIR